MALIKRQEYKQNTINVVIDVGAIELSLNTLEFVSINNQNGMKHIR